MPVRPPLGYSLDVYGVDNLVTGGPTGTAILDLYPTMLRRGYYSIPLCITGDRNPLVALPDGLAGVGEARPYRKSETSLPATLLVPRNTSRSARRHRRPLLAYEVVWD